MNKIRYNSGSVSENSRKILSGIRRNRAKGVIDHLKTLWDLYCQLRVPYLKIFRSGSSLEIDCNPPAAILTFLFPSFCISAEALSTAYASLQYAILYPFIAIFMESMKSSRRVSSGIFSNREVRIAYNSPAAPTAELSL